MPLSCCHKNLDQADDALEQKIDCQDHQRYHRCQLHAAHAVLELGDHQGDGSRGGGSQEGHGRNGHHTVDEQVGEHFRYGGYILGDEHIPQHTNSPNAQRLSHGLQICVHFPKGIIHHEVR